MRLLTSRTAAVLLVLVAVVAVAAAVEASQSSAAPAKGPALYVHKRPLSRYVHHSSGARYRHKRTTNFKTHRYVHARGRSFYTHKADPKNGRFTYRHSRRVGDFGMGRKQAAENASGANGGNGRTGANGGNGANGANGGNAAKPAAPAPAQVGKGGVIAAPKVASGVSGGSKSRVSGDESAKWDLVRRANVHAKRAPNAGIPAPYSQEASVRVEAGHHSAKGLTKLLPASRSSIESLDVHVYGRNPLSAAKLNAHLAKLEADRAADNLKVSKLIGKLNRCVDEETEAKREACVNKARKGLEYWKNRWTSA